LNNSPALAGFETRGNCETHGNGRFEVGREVQPEGHVHPTHRNHSEMQGEPGPCGPEPPNPSLILQLPHKSLLRHPGMSFRAKQEIKLQLALLLKAGSHDRANGMARLSYQVELWRFSEFFSDCRGSNCRVHPAYMK
jgi:hypothetical protein